MTISFTAFQIILIVLLLSWLVPLVTIWVRYDSLPHSQEMLFATLLYPLLFVDDVLTQFNLYQDFSFLIGLFRFTPALMAVLIFLAVRKIVQENSQGKRELLLPLGLFLLQIPFLILPADIKIHVLQSPIVGNLSANWPLFAYFAFSSFSVLFLTFKTERLMSEHQHYLSDQVVDISYYQMPFLGKMLNAMLSLAFGSLLLLMAVAFNWLPFTYWMSTLTLLQVIMNGMLIMMLLEKRRYSPSPLDHAVLEKNNFSDEQLRGALAKAEQAIIQYRAYKHIGLRIRHLCNVADVDPNILAVATRSLLKRNFRAFIYHYRLEYAKKVLMRTDAKVSAVAKRLGFNSEKFLSDVFVRYVGTMADKIDDPGPDLPLDDMIR